MFFPAMHLNRKIAASVHGDEHLTKNMKIRFKDKKNKLPWVLISKSGRAQVM